MPRGERRGAGGRPPGRRLGVMFLGAGASKAAGLPLTEELLRHIWPRDYEDGYAQWASIKNSRLWRADLEAAVRVLYPDGGSDGYRPLVSEFFTLLEVMERVHPDRERLPLDAGDLLRGLRAEIAMGLIAETNAKRRRAGDLPHSQWLKAPQGRPAVIITSNWDTLAEQTALRAGLKVRLTWPRRKNGTRLTELPPRTVVVLKLHGSVCRSGCSGYVPSKSTKTESKVSRRQTLRVAWHPRLFGAHEPSSPDPRVRARSRGAAATKTHGGDSTT